LGKPPTKNPCAQLVNLSITALIVANILFLGQKLPLLPWVAKWRISQQLDRTALALDQWRAAKGQYPHSLTEVLDTSTPGQIMPSLHDAVGNRIQYLRLGPDQYLLRSFGPDAMPATGTGHHDDVIQGSRAMPSPGGLKLSFAPGDTSIRGTWSPSSAEGAWSPDEKWIARIAANPDTGERLLVIVDDQRSRVLVSEHDRVEEFTWEPGEHLSPSIVFSATGSDLHGDGIYRWQIDTGVTENLMPKPEEPAGSGKAKDGKLPGSFGSTTQATDSTVRYAIAILQSPGGEHGAPEGLDVLAVRLDGPNGFHSRGGGQAGGPRFLDVRNLYRCTWRDGGCSRVKGNAASVRFRISPDQPWRQRGQMTPAQSGWVRLPVRGTARELLEKWFDAATSDRLVPLRPYVLFYAIILQDQIRNSAAIARDTQVSKRLRESADGMSDQLVGSADAARYLQILVSSEEREGLYRLGLDSQKVFEVTDDVEPAAQDKAKNGKKTEKKKR
jgi:hypothetical protein